MTPEDQVKPMRPLLSRAVRLAKCSDCNRLTRWVWLFGRLTVRICQSCAWSRGGVYRELMEERVASRPAPGDC